MTMRHPVAPIVLVCATLLLSHPALAQFSQQGLKLVGTGAVGTANQGASVALSADGNTAIVGAVADNSNAGAAWVWTRSAGVWTQQSKLVGSGAAGKAQQGASVSLSADGNTAIVGGNADNSNAGAAWVWTRSGGVWTQQSNKLVGSGASADARQGFSVSLSADGSTAIVGGYFDNSGPGAAWVWIRSGGVWSQQSNKLVGSGGVGNANQGYSVSLSADGNTAIVGGYFDNSGAGAAWVWIRSGGVWTQQGSKLAGSGAVGFARQGFSVSLSADGNTAIVGGHSDNGNAGAAWVWTRSGGVWSQQGSKLAGSGAVGNAQQGYSVAISADGNKAIVGGYLDNSPAGAAWVWTRSGGVWTQQSTKLVGSGAVENSNQGYSVALSADGNTAIVGGPGDNGKAGAAWVFAAAADPALVPFSQQGPKLVGTGAVGIAQQGYSVALSADGSTAIVGAWNDNDHGGAAWVWTRSGGVWTQQGPKLVGSGAVGAGAQQGWSVDLSADGNTAIVGGYFDNSGAGAAWVWTRSGGVWTQQGPKLVGSGGVRAFQGWSVALSADGNTAIVGGDQDNSNAGAAWVWTRTGGIWSQQGTKLVGSGVLGSGAFQGASVSLSADGNTAIVGGNRDNGIVGAAWVWTRSAGAWTQQGPKLIGSGTLGNTNQGNSVSLSADGNTAIVGGYLDNSSAGAAWVWTRSGGVWTQQSGKLIGSGAVGSAQQGISVSLSADGNKAIIGGFLDNSSVGAVWVWTRNGGVWTQQGSKLVGSGAVGVARQGGSVSLSADGTTAMVGGVGDNSGVGAAWVFSTAAETVDPPRRRAVRH